MRKKTSWILTCSNCQNTNITISPFIHIVSYYQMWNVVCVCMCSTETLTTGKHRSLAILRKDIEPTPDSFWVTHGAAKSSLLASTLRNLGTVLWNMQDGERGDSRRTRAYPAGDRKHRHQLYRPDSSVSTSPAIVGVSPVKATETTASPS